MSQFHWSQRSQLDFLRPTSNFEASNEPSIEVLVPYGPYLVRVDETHMMHGSLCLARFETWNVNCPGQQALQNLQVMLTTSFHLAMWTSYNRRQVSLTSQLRKTSLRQVNHVAPTWKSCLVDLKAESMGIGSGFLMKNQLFWLTIWWTCMKNL